MPDLAAKMNRFLHRSTNSNKYATFFYAQIDQRSRELRYVNAGHNPPYLARAARARRPDDTEDPVAEIEELPAGGTVLGLFPEVGYEQAAIALRSGDVLVVFTDGVPEAHDTQGDEFGEDRLKRLLQEVVHLPASEISARISDELFEYLDAPVRQLEVRAFEKVQKSMLKAARAAVASAAPRQ